MPEPSSVPLAPGNCHAHLSGFLGPMRWHSDSPPGSKGAQRTGESAPVSGPPRTRWTGTILMLHVPSALSRVCRETHNPKQNPDSQGSGHNVGTSALLVSSRSRLAKRPHANTAQGCDPECSRTKTSHANLFCCDFSFLSRVFAPNLPRGLL